MIETVHPTGGNQGSREALTREQQLPNSTGVLVMGILSIIFCWCWGVIGLILGIIGLILGGKSKKLYRENPGLYSEASWKNLNAGYICSLIGTILSALWMAVVIMSIIFGLAIGSSFLEYFPWENFNF
jgi:hypothetical protein